MTAHWCDDESFWQAIEPILFSDVRCGELAAQEVEAVVGLLGIEPGATVLDLCCGVGRHSLELAQRGFAVTGVDRTVAYLDKARRHAEERGLSVEYVRSDMGAFCRPESFDGAINLFTSFGFFETDDEELRVLTNVHRSLRPGARFVIDIMGKEVLCRRFYPRTWQSNAAGTVFLLEERKVSNGWASVENRWTVFDETGRREFRFPLRVYSGRELETLLRKAGFREVTLYGNLKGAPYDHEAERLVAVARK
jgi:SAM-dependent methyltransferase